MIDRAMSSAQEISCWSSKSVGSTAAITYQRLDGGGHVDREQEDG
jgi:hypothetical protein